MDKKELIENINAALDNGTDISEVVSGRWAVDFIERDEQGDDYAINGDGMLSGRIGYAIFLRNTHTDDEYIVSAHQEICEEMGADVWSGFEDVFNEEKYTIEQVLSDIELEHLFV